MLSVKEETEMVPGELVVVAAEPPTQLVEQSAFSQAFRLKSAGLDSVPPVKVTEKSVEVNRRPKEGHRVLPLRS